MKRFVLAVVAVALAIAACGSTASSDASELGGATCALDGCETRPPRRHRAALRPPARPTREWGRIWDTLPGSFPEIPGARPSEEAATGPASATLVIEGNVARLVATALVDYSQRTASRLRASARPWRTAVTRSMPPAPRPGCKVQATVKPMGGETFVTILYGAGLPARLNVVRACMHIVAAAQRTQALMRLSCS